MITKVFQKKVGARQTSLSPVITEDQPVRPVFLGRPGAHSELVFAGLLMLFGPPARSTINTILMGAGLIIFQISVLLPNLDYCKSYT